MQYSQIGMCNRIAKAAEMTEVFWLQESSHAMKVPFRSYNSRGIWVSIGLPMGYGKILTKF